MQGKALSRRLIILGFKVSQAALTTVLFSQDSDRLSERENRLGNGSLYKTGRIIWIVTVLFCAAGFQHFLCAVYLFFPDCLLIECGFRRIRDNQPR